jgi:hypothetical protein
LLDAGAAADVAGSTDEDVAGSGELAGGVLLPPQATTKPAAAVTARSTTSAMLFMIFSP